MRDNEKLAKRTFIVKLSIIWIYEHRLIGKSDR